MAKAKIGILGTGDVGKALGNGFTALGHDVKMGSREAKNEKAAAWAAKAGSHASTGTFADAAKFAEVAVIATIWSGTENAMKLAGPNNLAGKVVIDATNPLEFAPGARPRSRSATPIPAASRCSAGFPEPRWSRRSTSSATRTWSTRSSRAARRTCSSAATTPRQRRRSIEILRDFGWPSIDIGGIEGARLLEPTCVLWILYGIRSGSWDHAFKLLRK